LSFRTIAQDLKISVGKSYETYFEALKNLPVCIDLTRNYCSRFCGILLVDGKYLKVKGYKKKIPVIYGVDYLTHDIVHFALGPPENYKLLLKFFSSLKLANYPLQAVVSDDNRNIPEACLKVYPNAIWQLCQNHYKHNLRITLSLANDPTYKPFMRQVETLFSGKLSPDDFKGRARKIYDKYKSNTFLEKIMFDIAKRSGDLTAYTKLKNIPRTTNLIESFNSHLQGRLKTIKGFQNFKTAKLWLNAYFIKRRLKPFTDCTKQFKNLNGKSSLEQTLKDNYKIEDVLKLIK
jgi:transposase-like protein